MPQEVTARRLRKSQANTAQDFVCEEFIINGTVYLKACTAQLKEIGIKFLRHLVEE